MKTIFCSNQQKEYNAATDMYKIYCNIYGKECPYSKPAKAQKKCTEVYFIEERPVYSNDDRREEY